jgi:methyl-accepting chemotaxis protein
MSTMSWPIRRSLGALTGIILVACAIAGGVAWSQYNRSSAAQRNLTAQLKARVDVDRLAVLMKEVGLDIVVIQYVPNAAAQESPLLNAATAEVASIASAQSTAAVPQAERDAITKVAGTITDYVTWATSVKKITTKAELQQASDQYNALLAQQAAAIKTAQDMAGAGVDSELSSVQGAMRGLALMMLALCVGAAVLLPGLLLAFGRGLIGRMTMLGDALRKVSGGDLTIRVPDSGTDEVSTMARHVNETVTGLAGVFGSIRAASGRLAGAATSLQEVAARVDRSAQETSSRAEAVARAADEVSQNVQSVAAGSGEMGTSISEIARNAHEAAEVATGAVQAVESTTTTMTKLSDSSREIGDVVRLITSIAEQTNLLALNATIEAARAGDAGKGFAVVADEVKQLAQETARATEDISRRVEAIQSDADQAARAITDVAGVISRINEFQTTIASAVEEQTATTQSINTGVSIAASGSGQIAQNISGVASAAGDTAASMTAASASARELSDVSDELTHLLAGFRI